MDHVMSFMSFVRRFARDRRAVVMPLFALSMVPIFWTIGTAVDYSRANAMRTSMQAALDSTALMLSKEIQSLTPAEITPKAHAYFTSLFDWTGAKDVILSTSFQSPQQGSFILRVTGSAKVDTVFGKFDPILGSYRDQIDIGMSAEVKWGVKRLELALVLDNTGSMASNGKLAALKAAAHNLIDTLKAAAKNPGDVKVAIIPFDTTVNVGPNAKAVPMFDWSVYDINPNTWEGCVADRTQDYDVTDVVPTIPPAVINQRTLYPAKDCGSLTMLMPLNENWTALHSKIDAMTAAGSTNTTIGLVWGWHALTGFLPLTEAEAPKPDLDKVIILLTDGENTRNRWTTRTSSIDARTQAACANIKAANIKIYTVRVIDGNAALLKNCATRPDMYYDVQQASQLYGVFTSIAQNLANLRVSQ